MACLTIVLKTVSLISVYGAGCCEMYTCVYMSCGGSVKWEGKNDVLCQLVYEGKMFCTHSIEYTLSAPSEGYATV